MTDKPVTPAATLPTAINGRIVGTATIARIEGDTVITTSGLTWVWDEKVGALVAPKLSVRNVIGGNGERRKV